MRFARLALRRDAGNAGPAAFFRAMLGVWREQRHGVVTQTRPESIDERHLCGIGFIIRQQAEIEAVNAKWLDFFNKGDFAGVASLYTEDATALPPGLPMAKGRAAIEVMWKNMAEQVGDPKLTTLDVKSLGPLCGARDRHLQPQSQGFDRSHRGGFDDL